MGKSIRESSVKDTLGKKFQSGNVYPLTEKKGYSYQCVCVDEMKLAGKKQNISPTWKTRMQDVDLGEPTSFLDVFLYGLHSKRVSNKQGYCG